MEEITKPIKMKGGKSMEVAKVEEGNGRNYETYKDEGWQINGSC